MIPCNKKRFLEQKLLTLNLPQQLVISVIMELFLCGQNYVHCFTFLLKLFFVVTIQQESALNAFLFTTKTIKIKPLLTLKQSLKKCKFLLFRKGLSLVRRMLKQPGLISWDRHLPVIKYNWRTYDDDLYYSVSFHHSIYNLK